MNRLKSLGTNIKSKTRITEASEAKEVRDSKISMSNERKTRNKNILKK